MAKLKFWKKNKAKKQKSGDNPKDDDSTASVNTSTPPKVKSKNKSPKRMNRNRVASPVEEPMVSSITTVETSHQADAVHSSFLELSPYGGIVHNGHNGSPTKKTTFQEDPTRISVTNLNKLQNDYHLNPPTLSADRGTPSRGSPLKGGYTVDDQVKCISRLYELSKQMAADKNEPHTPSTTGTGTGTGNVRKISPDNSLLEDESSPIAGTPHLPAPVTTPINHLTTTTTQTEKHNHSSSQQQDSSVSTKNNNNNKSNTLEQQQQVLQTPKNKPPSNKTKSIDLSSPTSILENLYQRGENLYERTSSFRNSFRDDSIRIASSLKESVIDALQCGTGQQHDDNEEYAQVAFETNNSTLSFEHRGRNVYDDSTILLQDAFKDLCLMDTSSMDMNNERNALIYQKFQEHRKKFFGGTTSNSHYTSSTYSLNETPEVSHDDDDDYNDEENCDDNSKSEGSSVLFTDEENDPSHIEQYKTIPSKQKQQQQKLLKEHYAKSPSAIQSSSQLSSYPNHHKNQDYFFNSNNTNSVWYDEYLGFLMNENGEEENESLTNGGTDSEFYTRSSGMTTAMSKDTYTSASSYPVKKRMYSTPFDESDLESSVDASTISFPMDELL